MVASASAFKGLQSLQTHVHPAIGRACGQLGVCRCMHIMHHDAYQAFAFVELLAAGLGVLKWCAAHARRQCLGGQKKKTRSAVLWNVLFMLT